jgi:malonyl-CoA O-methyltransferase
MSARMKQRVRRHFEAAAHEYDKAAIVQRRIARDLARNLAQPRSFPPAAPDTVNHTVLEIGAGVGTLVREVLPVLDCRTYIAADIARTMLARLMAQKMAPVLPLVADGEHLPLVPGSVDLLLSSSTMQWYQNPERSIPANLALLRPGGHFAITLFVHGTLGELADASQRTGFGSVHPLARAERILEIFSTCSGIEYSHSLRRDRVEHPDAMSMLRALRRTGAGYSANKRGVSPRRLRAFCREYETRFACAEGVYATYVSLCLAGRKKQ